MLWLLSLFAWIHDVCLCWCGFASAVVVYRAFERAFKTSPRHHKQLAKRFWFNPHRLANSFWELLELSKVEERVMIYQ